LIGALTPGLTIFSYGGTMPKVINSENALADNEDRLRKLEEDRLARFDQGLREENLDFDMEKNNDDPEEQHREYVKDAHRGLKAILAKAGEEEAKVAGRKFGGK
jgi:hypothetical protein